mmetsp:Transcript_49475/g.99670  ORF Transcript_49475/g.99670 Transcript_49475/m.99670 type:complete len:238 (+) Transcript_49475:202-915(+)
MGIAAAVVNVHNGEVLVGIRWLAPVEDPGSVYHPRLLTAESQAHAQGVPASPAILEEDHQLVLVTGIDLEHERRAGVHAGRLPGLLVRGDARESSFHTCHGTIRLLCEVAYPNQLVRSIPIIRILQERCTEAVQGALHTFGQRLVGGRNVARLVHQRHFPHELLGGVLALHFNVQKGIVAALCWRLHLQQPGFVRRGILWRRTGLALALTRSVANNSLRCSQNQHVQKQPSHQELHL